MRVVTNNGSEYLSENALDGYFGHTTKVMQESEELKELVNRPDAVLIECDFKSHLPDIYLGDTAEFINERLNTHEIREDDEERIEGPHDRWEIDEIVLRVRKVHYPDGFWYENYGEGLPIWNDHPETQVKFITANGEMDVVDRRKNKGGVE